MIPERWQASHRPTSDIIIEIERRNKDGYEAKGELKDQLVNRNGGKKMLYYSFYSYNA